MINVSLEGFEPPTFPPQTERPTTGLQRVFGSGNAIRTHDLQVMSLIGYHFPTPQLNLILHSNYISKF